VVLQHAGGQTSVKRMNIIQLYQEIQTDESRNATTSQSPFALSASADTFSSTHHLIIKKHANIFVFKACFTNIKYLMAFLSIITSTVRVASQSTVKTNLGNYNLVKQQDSFFRDNGTVNKVVKGYWKSIGNGYILDATSDSIFLYSFTKNFCYKEKNDHIERLLNNKARFVLRKDTLSIYGADYEDKSTLL
jgi:hypothetical protein